MQGTLYSVLDIQGGGHGLVPFQVFSAQYGLGRIHRGSVLVAAEYRMANFSGTGSLPSVSPVMRREGGARGDCRPGERGGSALLSL